MNWLIKLIAIATYKGKIQKHSIVLSLVLVFNPILSALILLLYALLVTKINVLFFLSVSLIFHTAITYVLYRNYNSLIKGINKSTLMKITNFKRGMYGLGYIVLVIVCILLAVVIVGYGSVFIDKLQK